MFIWNVAGCLWLVIFGWWKRQAGWQSLPLEVWELALLPIVHYTELYSCFLTLFFISLFLFHSLSFVLPTSIPLFDIVIHTLPHSGLLLLCARPLRLSRSLAPSLPLSFYSHSICHFTCVLSVFLSPTIPPSLFSVLSSWQALSFLLTLSFDRRLGSVRLYSTAAGFYPCGNKHLDEPTWTFYINPTWTYWTQMTLLEEHLATWIHSAWWTLSQLGPVTSHHRHRFRHLVIALLPWKQLLVLPSFNYWIISCSWPQNIIRTGSE